MGNRQLRLKELREELDRTYQEMRDILIRNGTPRIMVSSLPPEEFKRWYELNLKSTQLINEFISLIGDNIKHE